MTSPTFNARKRAAAVEMEILDALPAAVRAAINSAETSVRASVVHDTLIRGVSEEAIIETLSKRSPKP